MCLVTTILPRALCFVLTLVKLTIQQVQVGQIFSALTVAINNIVVVVIMQIIFSIVWTMIAMGIIKMVLDVSADKQPNWRDLYLQVPLFGKFLVGYIIYGFLVGVGLALFIIPGIIWGIKYGFVHYLIIDQKLSPMAALKKSAEMTQGVKMDLFLFLLASSVLMGVAVIPFGLGMLIAAPVVNLAMIYIYRKLLNRQVVV